MRMTALDEDTIAGSCKAWRSTAASRVENDAECRSEPHAHRAMDPHPTRARHPGHRPWTQSHGGRVSRSDRSSDEKAVEMTPGPVLDGPPAARGKDEG